MPTAREQAIEAMAARFAEQNTDLGVGQIISDTLYGAGYESLLEFILDAIPPQLHAQLAIDNGALEPVVFDVRDDDGNLTGYEIEVADGTYKAGGDEIFYRLMEP